MTILVNGQRGRDIGGIPEVELAAIAKRPFGFTLTPAPGERLRGVCIDPPANGTIAFETAEEGEGRVSFFSSAGFPEPGNCFLDIRDKTGTVHGRIVCRVIAPGRAEAEPLPSGSVPGFPWRDPEEMKVVAKSLLLFWAVVMIMALSGLGLWKLGAMIYHSTPERPDAVTAPPLAPGESPDAVSVGN